MPTESAQPREIGERPVLEADTLDILSEILEHGEPDEQCLAIKTLQAWQVSGARDLLVKATRSEDPGVRVVALEALVSIEATGVGDVFLWSLENDPTGAAKVAALRGLGPQDGDAAVALVRKLILGRSEEQAARKEETSDCDDWLDVQREAIRATGRLGLESAVPDILSAANDEFGQDLWNECLSALAALGRPGLMALIDVGQSPSELQRERAARALEASGDPLAVKAIEALCLDRSAEVRAAALEATVGRKLPIADWRLIKEPSPVIRKFVAEKSPTVGNVDLVRLATNDESAEVRLAAVRRLTERRPSPDQIADLLVHARTRLRSEPEDYILALVRVLERARGNGRLELLQDILEHDPKPAVQRAVAEALVAFDSPEVLDILKLLLAHENQMIRHSALTSLARLSYGEGAVADNAAALLFLAANGQLLADHAIPEMDQVAFQEEKFDFSEEDLIFLELVQSTLRKEGTLSIVTPEVAIDIRRIAVRLIGELDGQAFTVALLRCAQSSDDDLRTAAFDAVARRASRGVRLTDRGWEILNALPPDNYPQARSAFLAILSSMPAEVAETRLKQALQSGEAMDVAAALTVCGQLGQAPEELGSFLSSEDRSIRKAAIGLAFTCDQQAFADEVLNAAFSESGALGGVLAIELVKSGAGGLKTTLFKKLEKACRAGGVQRQLSLQVLSQIGRQAGLS